MRKVQRYGEGVYQGCMWRDMRGGAETKGELIVK